MNNAREHFFYEDIFNRIFLLLLGRFFFTSKKNATANQPQKMHFLQWFSLEKVPVKAKK